MSDELESSTAEPEVAQNPAVLHCLKARERAYELASLTPKRKRPNHQPFDGFAEDQADLAFFNAMPPLRGYENIQNFIACIAYALVHGIFLQENCEHLLRCARAALSACRAQSKR